MPERFIGKSSYENALLVGLDIGTSGAKAALVNSRGVIVGRGYKAYEVMRQASGAAEQDAEMDWWGGAVEAIQHSLEEANASPEQVVAMGCSAQGPNIVLLDENCKALRPAIIWQDTRSSDVAARLDKALRKENVWTEKHPPLLSQSYAAPLIWLRENEPQVYSNAYKILTTLGFLIFRLTGEFVVDKATASGMLPLFSLEEGCWDRKVLGLLSIEYEELPTVVPSHSVIGHLLGDSANELGLIEGLPVVAGTGDTMADLISAGVFASGQAAFTYGTIFGLMKCLNEPIPDTFCFAHGVESVYLLAGGVPVAGGSLRWFQDNLAYQEKQRAEKTGESIYQLIEKMGRQSPPGAEGLMVLPLFDHPDITSDFPAGASILGLRLAHNRTHLYRALVEGIGYEIRRQLVGLPGPEIKEAIAIGGGAQDGFWTQIVSDITGLVQKRRLVSHGAPLGAAYLAGRGVGLFEGMEQLVDVWLGEGDTIIPNQETQHLYEDGYSRYLTARSHLATRDFP